jgi:hypothetical protein
MAYNFFYFQNPKRLARIGVTIDEGWDRRIDLLDIHKS